jgi:hypothetical protein
MPSNVEERSRRTRGSNELNDLNNQPGVETIDKQVVMRWVVRLVAISFSLIVSALILVILAIFAAGNFVAESTRK